MITERVRRTLATRGLVRRGDAIVVAVSGGPDSSALLHVLAQLAPGLELRLVAVGIDHGLRASASVELDAAETLARSLGVAFERARIDEKPSGASIQSWARRVRYEALHASARRASARVIATGHTMDDQAETVLARLLRGGGLRGLAGIDPQRGDGVVRPLIDCRRDAVRAYLVDAGIGVVLDPSNEEPRFERTRVRAQIVPALLAEQPLAVDRLAALADEAREADRALDAEAAGLLARASRAGQLEIAPLGEAAPPIAMRALRRWAEEKSSRAIGRAHLVALMERLHMPGEVLLPGGSVVRREAERLHLEEGTNEPRLRLSAPMAAPSPEERRSDEEE